MFAMSSETLLLFFVADRMVPRQVEQPENLIGTGAERQPAAE
jgi:hypothetical protein